MRTLSLLALAMGCARLPAAPVLVRDGSSVDDVAMKDGPMDVAAPTDGVDAPGDNAPPPDVIADVPDAPMPARPRLTGTFVSSAVPTSMPAPRLTGGFVWHGAARGSRLEGWLR